MLLLDQLQQCGKIDDLFGTEAFREKAAVLTYTTSRQKRRLQGFTFIVEADLLFGESVAWELLSPATG